MKLIGKSIQERIFEVTGAINAMAYSLDKLTAQEAIIALDAVRAMAKQKLYEDHNQMSINLDTTAKTDVMPEVTT